MSNGRFSNDSHTEAFLGTEIRPAYLGYFDFASGPVRIWGPGAFTLTWGGFEWAGGGALVHIDTLEESTDGSAKTTEVRLSPIPRVVDGFDVDILQIALNEDWHGRTAILYAGLFESNSLSWKMEPMQFRKGFMDVMELTEEGQMGRIRLTIEKEDYDNQRTDVRRYTPAAQRALYSGDAFFDQVPSLQEKQIILNFAQENIMAQGQATLNEILEAVRSQSSQIKSLNTFVEGLQEAIRNQGIPPAEQTKIDALFAEIKANDQAIADAFTANTPAVQPTKA